MRIALVVVVVVVLAACRAAPSPTAPAPAAPQVYTSDRVAAQLAELERGGKLAVERIGTTAQQRPILLARIGTRGPATLVIFGLHPDEHDMPMLGMEIVRRAVADRAFANRRLYVVPLANPDGTAHDLASAQPLTYRKNGRANLNRNWGAHWQPGGDPAAADYPGTAAFSEPETRALRDFMHAHPEIAAVVDVHSGSSSFNQGFILFPYSYADRDVLDAHWRARYDELATRFATQMTCSADDRAAFAAVQSWEVGDRVRAYLRGVVPPAQLDAALASVPASTAASGTSIDWVHDTLGKPALGVEIARPFEASTPAAFARATAQHLERCGDAYYRAIVAAP